MGGGRRSTRRGHSDLLAGSLCNSYMTNFRTDFVRKLVGSPSIDYRIATRAEMSRRMAPTTKRRLPAPACGMGYSLGPLPGESPTDRQLIEEAKGLELHVSDGPAEAARDAARGLAQCIRDAVRARGLCTLAVSGGSTPNAMFAVLAQEEVPWESVHVFQVDERVAPAGDRERNWVHLHTILLSKVAMAPTHMHPMPVELADLHLAAKNYAALLTGAAGNPPVIDVVHLGLGRDGHTASLTPDDPVLGELKSEVAVTQEYQGHRRLTLTYPCLRRARQIVWLVTGSDKAEMLQRLQRADQSIPAGRLFHERSVAYVDRAAAAAR